MTAAVRADALRNFTRLVTELGGEPSALLRAEKISPESIARPDAYIPFRSMAQLLERAAATLKCPDFGLRLAARQEPEMFGPIAVAAQNCETLGDAIDCFARYFHTHNAAVQIQQRAAGRSVHLAVEILIEGLPHHAQFDERSAALMHRSMKLLSAGRCRPQQVLLPHARLAAASVYAKAFDCPVAFGQAFLGVEIAKTDLRLPVVGHNPQLRQLATAFLDQQGQRPQAALSARVRQAIRALLSGGTCSHQSVAEALHVHPRTLQRRLAEEGTTFEVLRDGVRRELAERYLAQPGLPLSHVTALLGYAEQSALTRSCRRWFRRTPRTMQAAREDGNANQGNTRMNAD